MEQDPAPSLESKGLLKGLLRGWKCALTIGYNHLPFSFWFPTSSKDVSGFAAWPLVTHGIALAAIGYDVAPKGMWLWWKQFSLPLLNISCCIWILCFLPRPAGSDGQAGAAQCSLCSSTVHRDQVGAACVLWRCFRVETWRGLEKRSPTLGRSTMEITEALFGFWFLWQSS